MRPLMLLAAVAGVAACSPTPEGFAKKKTVATCEWLVDCLGAYTDVDVCVEGTTTPALDPQTCEYDAGAAAGCLDVLDALTCATPPDTTAFLCEAAYPNCAEESVYLQQSVELACTWAVECYPGSYSSLASCIANADTEIPPGCVYDPRSARQCLTGLAQLTCASDPSSATPAACDTVYACP